MKDKDIRFLIDTGSSKSFLSPDIANKFFSNSIVEDPFTLSCVFGKRAYNYSTSLHISKILSDPRDLNLKFYIFQFHNFYNGLLGLDNLKLINALIDNKNGMLLTPYSKIKLLSRPVQNFRDTHVSLTQNEIDKVIKLTPSTAKTTESYSSDYEKFINSNVESASLLEVEKDIFALSDDYCLAHCVSRDFIMSKGIAYAFKKKFAQLDKLVKQHANVGGLAYLQDKNRFIYYLVTKEKFYLKPEYEVLFDSLVKLRNHMIENDKYNLGIPRLGCGLDMLDWNVVRKMIYHIFCETNINIIVCNWDLQRTNIVEDMDEVIYEQNQLIEINEFNFEISDRVSFEDLRMEHLNKEEKTMLFSVLNDFNKLEDGNGDKNYIAETVQGKIKHRIRTHDEVPVYTKSYRYPNIHKEEVKSQINKMLEEGIIKESFSPWSSPIWIVPKKDDASGLKKWRLVVDYRKLNEKTVDDKYPIPNITDLLDKLGRAQYFSTIDLASGFHQIDMDERDIEKTAFSTENGHFEYLKMPFGLKNAPATFQRFMENLLKGIINEKCLVYMDDIIIFASSLQEHMDNLRAVLKKLKSANLKLQFDKCEFLRKEVAYLGHVVTPEGVKPNPDKIRAIKKFPIPEDKKAIRSFVNLLGYYRRFINNFAQITKPLTKCLKKNSKVTHDKDFLDCFEKCKQLLINEPILKYPDFSQIFTVTTDASDVALGAVLSQGNIGNDLPVAYASRTLNDTERRLSTIEKELLGVVWSIQYFRPYLFGRRFNIVTDHKPLTWLFSIKDPSSKLFRWRMKLEEYEYDIIYKKGKNNTNADCLSRIELSTNAIETATDTSATLSATDSSETLTASDASMTLTATDSSETELGKTFSLIVEPDEDNGDNLDLDDVTIHTNYGENPAVTIPISELCVNSGQNQIFVSIVKHSPVEPIIKKIFCDKIRFYLQLSENNFQSNLIDFIKDYLTEKVSYHVYFEDERIHQKFSEVVRENLNWPSFNFKRCMEKLLDIEDQDEQDHVIQNYHEGKTNHRGITETYERIKSKYYWPGLKESVRKFINNCEICQRVKYDRNPLKMQFNITPTPCRPFEILHADTFSVEQGKFLTLIDKFSRYGQAYYLESLNATDIANKLLQYFSHHGIPLQIVTDNGTEFKNTVVQELLALHKIDIHFTTPNHPNSNSPIERFHSTILEHIRLLNTRGFLKTPSQMKMIYAILAYNNSIHSVTKLKPCDVVTGHFQDKEIFDIDLEKQLLTDYINQHRECTRIIYSALNEKLITDKEKLINKLNERRENIKILENVRIFPKNHTRQKTANKFEKPEEVIEQKDEFNVLTTTRRNKIHLDNVKRPHKP